MNIKIELILEIWIINWIFYKYDLFFMNINYESRIWFEIDEYNLYLMNINHDMKVWFMIKEYNSCLMNINHLKVK